MRLPKLLLGIFLSALTACAMADIYECPDAGGPRYTDAKEPGCKLLIGDASSDGAAKQVKSAVTMETKRRALQPSIHAAARRHGLLPSLLEAVIQVESGFRDDALSVKGAMGLTQLMPATAELLGVRNAFDPGANIEGGAKHLRGLLDRYRGDAKMALAAYNAGVGAVERYGTIPPFRETQDYVVRVTRLQRQLANGAAAQ